MVDAEGILTGSDESGCMFNGQIANNSWFSAVLYEVSVSVSGCPAVAGRDLDGSYVGEGAVLDSEAGSHADDFLVIGISNDNNVIAFSLGKI